jgi:hypothetical protein
MTSKGNRTPAHAAAEADHFMPCIQPGFDQARCLHFCASGDELRQVGHNQNTHVDLCPVLVRRREPENINHVLQRSTSTP